MIQDLGSEAESKLPKMGRRYRAGLSSTSCCKYPASARGKPPVLNITDLVEFKVIVPPLDITSLDYMDRVKYFRVGTADPENLFASIILSAPNIKFPTGQQTPLKSSRPILYKKKLGAGSLGLMKYVWNVKTGDEYVMKRLLQKLIDSGQGVELEK